MLAQLYDRMRLRERDRDLFTMRKGWSAGDNNNLRNETSEASPLPQAEAQKECDTGDEEWNFFD